MDGNAVVEGFTLGGLFPGSELVFDVSEFNGVPWLLDGGGGVDFLQRGHLGGDLLEGWEFLLFHSDVERISSNDDQWLEVLVGSRAASKVDEDGLALVQGVGVVEFDGRVSHIKSGHLVASGEVDVLNNQDEPFVRVAELLRVRKDTNIKIQI